ncbi:MAG: hypothetical protein HQK99_04690 [Nitrospirae bacterium]|nr:hypothetical protein [Nitrospirota bacterium]
MESQLLGALRQAITAVAANINAIYDIRKISKPLNLSAVLYAIGLGFRISNRNITHAPAAAIPQNVRTGQNDKAVKRLRTSVDITISPPHTTVAAIKEARALR